MKSEAALEEGRANSYGPSVILYSQQRIPRSKQKAESKEEEIPLPSKVDQVSARQDYSKKNNNGRTKKLKSKKSS